METSDPARVAPEPPRDSPPLAGEPPKQRKMLQRLGSWGSLPSRSSGSPAGGSAAPADSAGGEPTAD